MKERLYKFVSVVMMTEESLLNIRPDIVTQDSAITQCWSGRKLERRGGGEEQDKRREGQGE